MRTVVPAMALAVLAVSARPAMAEPLTTLWTMEPVAAERAISVRYGERFFEERLVPVAAVRLQQAGGAAELPDGAFLYLVTTSDRRTIYCTFKDRRVGHMASGLFLPMLDKRPCLIDSDQDGRFERTFSVFDKFGSVATPSGNPDAAVPLPAPIRYQTVDPRMAPEAMRVAFTLSGPKDPARARVGVELKRTGQAKWKPMIGPILRSGSTLTAMNVDVTIRTVSDGVAQLDLAVNPSILLSGSSDGTLRTTTAPTWLKRP